VRGGREGGAGDEEVLPHAAAIVVRVRGGVYFCGDGDGEYFVGARGKGCWDGGRRDGGVYVAVGAAEASS